MVDVARESGFSRTTVSYVLNGRTDVSIPQPTRSEILRVAAALGYRPNSIARSLVSRRTRTLGVMVPSLESAFEAEIVNGIQEACARRDYRMLLTYYRKSEGVGDELGQARLLLENRVEGLISLSSHLGPAAARVWLDDAAADGVECVLVDQCYGTDAGRGVDCVVSDDVAGARVAVRHLLELGHRRIGHLAGPVDATPARERRAGYDKALSEAGMQVDPSLIVITTFSGAGLGGALTHLLNREEPPTALFAANDQVAAETHLALRESGLRIPEDVALVSYGDLPLARFLGLTTMHQDPRELGRRAAARLFDRLEEPGQPASVIRVPTQLVVRHSCGAHRRNIGPSQTLKERTCGGVAMTADSAYAQPCILNSAF